MYLCLFRIHHLLIATSVWDNKYTIVNTAYFYDAPDKNSRTNIYLTAGDAKLTLLDETDDFRQVDIY